MADRPDTPGQTIGPFFAGALRFPGDNMLVDATHPGAIRLHGKVFDGADEPISDGLVELWQAGPDGAMPRPGQPFTGWGRCGTDPAGRYEFTTLAPGSPAGAPVFFALTVFARGLLDRLFTRAYLPGTDLAGEPALAGLHADRRATLLAAAEANGYRFDIHLQGRRETVFFDHRGERS